MSRHHYPISSLSSDYLRVAVGLALTLGPLLLLDLARPVAWLLAVLAALFAWFGLRTGVRQLSLVELSPEGIAIRGPFGRSLAWDELARVRLAYYTPRGWSSARRRDRGGEPGERDPGRRGWLQLTVQGTHGRPIRVESTLEGFEQVLRRTMATVSQKQLGLDPTTAANLAALGLDRDDPAPPLRPAAADRGFAARPGPRGSL
ncbi:MAG TPA: hypothetical protein VFV80_14580 [Geminicoccaceae bacterium]|nr:hypothetical protein [Geminicoccaceae bacterium]